VVERLSAPAAIERIRAHRERNELVLGVEGFLTVRGGYMASLDLILDLSSKQLSASEAAAEAEAFVTAHAADDLTFEVVA
jgi:hypothetical protein